MAKLYWRVKRNNKWTWTAAEVTGWTTDGLGGHIVEPLKQSEYPTLQGPLEDSE